jgi:membrane protein implicated in regulation of membrane protease activity
VTTYLVIGLVGLVLLTVSLVAGDLLDGAFDALAADWFSSAVIAGFVSAFGFGGALAAGLGAPTLVTVGVGVVAGVLFGWFASWLTRAVKGGGSGETVQAADTVGYDATVVTDIPAGGFGVVRVHVNGQTLRLNARAESELGAGTPAHVTGVLSPTAVTVAPTWTELP